MDPVPREEHLQHWPHHRPDPAGEPTGEAGLPFPGAGSTSDPASTFLRPGGTGPQWLIGVESGRIARFRRVVGVACGGRCPCA